MEVTLWSVDSRGDDMVHVDVSQFRTKPKSASRNMVSLVVNSSAEIRAPRYYTVLNLPCYEIS